jgi:integrase
MTVRELCELYLSHCRVYYRKPSGRPTREANNVADALRALLELAGDEPVEALSPKLLRQVQQQQARAGTVARSTINARINRIRRMARWAALEELLPDDLPHRLAIVPPLRHGRTAAPESPGVEPVPWADVEATLKALRRERRNGPAYGRKSRLQLATLIEFHWWTGCRPSEACQAAKSLIDRTGPVWIYTPAEHKNQHHGHDRVIAIGPRAQEALAAWWDRVKYDCLFSARSGTPMCVRNYGLGVQRVNERNKLRPWNPGQIRHSAATRFRQEAGGLDAAQRLLGHRHADTTQIYADLEHARTIELAAQVG